MKLRINTIQTDRLGIVASVLCAIHCAAMPFLLGALQLLGLQLFAQPWLEGLMICISILLGIYSLGKAVRLHKKTLPILMLVTGFAMIAAGRLYFHSYEIFIVPLGGFVIAFAHFKNIGASRGCRHE